MSNLFVRLKQILPPSPVWIGLVTEHHDDDTSTVVLPTNEGTFAYAAGVSTGSTIRPRGTFVPVGEKAFIRDGVIETRAPDGDPVEIEVGRVVQLPDELVFSGPIPDRGVLYNESAFLELARYWQGGLRPLSYSVASGSAPDGMLLNPVSGILGGTPTTLGQIAALSVAATDGWGRSAASNVFSVSVNPFAFYSAGLTFVDVLEILQEGVDAKVEIVADSAGSPLADPGVNLVCAAQGYNTNDTLYGGYVLGGSTSVWAVGLDEPGAPSPLYYRFRHAGSPFEALGGISTGGFFLDTGVVLDTWSTANLFRVVMRGYAPTMPGINRYEKTGTLTIQVATDALGANIVAELTVAFRLAMQVSV